MIRRRPAIAAAFSVLIVALFFAGCGEDQVGGSDVSDLCPDGECVSCDGEADCDAATYCHDEGVCAEVECEPGTSACDGSSTVRCNDTGSGYLEPETCSTGVCTDGQCGCDGGSDCADSEACSGGLCVCSSEVRCGDDGICCGDGEVCAETEICDDEGECEQFRACRPECEGTVCGMDGELCCEGDTPECGPRGECAPDCSNGGDLCGENFDECCAFGDVCIFGECRLPGDDCEHFSECDFGEYCDEGLGKCMSDDFPDGLVCEDEYDFAEIEPAILWEWEGAEIDGETYINVMMTPLVADMTGDGVPNVLVNAYRADGNTTSYPVVIDGATGETSHYYNSRATDFGAQLAAVDITGNDVPEIVAVQTGTAGIGVIENYVDCPDPENDEDGCYLWWNDEDVNTNQGAPVVSDLNADGNVEIVLRDKILNGLTGELIATLDAGGYDYTVTADVTGDGRLEILGAGCLYSLDDEHNLSELWCTDVPVASADRRFAAVGDLTDEDGRDGMPEFLITGDGTAHIVAADTGQVLHQFELPGGGEGGSPIIADFDGDDRAEFGVAGAACYTVFDLDCVVDDPESDDVTEDQSGCMRPEIETCEFGHHCACEDLADTGGTGDGVLWSIYVQDASSHRTGSSVFDFQGNGRNEVVYNDECLLMVLDGQDGSPYFRYGNTNRTSSEYPLIVDVNGDNQTNIVVSANNDQFSRDCEDPINEQPERFPECHPEDGEPVPTWCTEGTTGVIALQDPEDRWVRTRSIWNQFDYYIDNATDTAGVPTSPSMPWESHNTFRANRQGEVPLNAPDVVVSSVQVNARFCPVDIDFRATVENLGVAAIPEGIPVSLYYFDNTTDPTLVATKTIDQAISPGGMAIVDFNYQVSASQLNQDLDFMVVANDDGEGGAPARDCNPDDAKRMVEDVVCSYQL